MSAPSDTDTSVQVALRIRPQSASEKIDLCHVCTSVTAGHPQVVLGKDKAFTYDYVFDIDSEQPNIYDEIARPLIEGCFDGYNATIVAYGQTGAGKTYTMGTSFGVGVPEESIGIIPRSAKHLFEGIQRFREKAEEDGKSQPEFKVTAQFLELYNEEIIDLLDIENKGRKNIRVHEDHNGLIYMTGVVSKPVGSANDCMTLLEEGAISRTTASTNMNATSSRSHAIFTLFIKHYRLIENPEEGGENEFETLNAKFNFVDLAGSERLKRTGATGDRAKEGISINQGLLSLGNVISALGDKAKRGSHVPYRDSKLTRLLQDSLGGNSRTLMIACVSPSDRDFMETLNTLKYANRARNIKNKVMVNQDKASKQIALLRQEIQQLNLELLEYKQGKRVADSGGEHMTDTFNELAMLQRENETLRMRVKALQHSIDSQTIQLTELKVTSALAGVSEGDRATMTDMVTEYEKKILELSNKVQESEAMSSAAIRRAQTVSRMAMSPGHVDEGQDSVIFSLIDHAKQDLKKEKKMKKKLSKKKVKVEATILETSPEPAVSTTDVDVVVLSDTDNDDSPRTQQETHEEQEQQNGEHSVNGNTVVDDVEVDGEGEFVEDEDEDEEDEEEEELLSNTDSDDDDELNQSLQEEAMLQNKISDLDSDIDLKQKLIDELEHSQQKITALKHSYEEKMSLLHNKIKETENERDKVLKTVGSVDVAAREKSDAIRKRYEKKLLDMQKELKKFTNLKREQVRLQKTKETNENQLKQFRNEMNEMKKQKVKLMRHMRDEVNRNKRIEGKLNQQMESVMKENRRKDVELKRLKDDKKQRDLVLKRKQEELLKQKQEEEKGTSQDADVKNQIKAIRKQIRPASGNVTSRNGRTSSRANSLHQQYQSASHQNLNSTFVVDEPKTDVMRTPTKRKIPIAEKGLRSPAVSKKAKHKWEILDRKITETMLRMKNVAQIENDMERFMVDREKVSRQLDSACKRLLAKEKELEGTDMEESLEYKDLRNQVEGMEAQLDYIQENIKENQGVIMDIEEEGQGVDAHGVITTSTLSETKYLLEHFYSKAIETATELANRDAAYKEIQIKLEAMEKHCEVQQQLLQHACQAEGIAFLEDDNSSEQLPDVINVSSTRKNRRKTALPEDLLHPKESKKPPLQPTQEAPQLKVIEISSDSNDDEEDDGDGSQAENEEKENTNKLEEKPEEKLPERSPFKLDEKLLSKLKDIEKRVQMKSNQKELSSQTFDSGRQRSGSFSETDKKQNVTLPSSFQRNTKITRSARPFGKSSSGSNLKRPLLRDGKYNASLSSSNKNSPLTERRTYGESTNTLTATEVTTSSAATNESCDSKDVFTRLTSSLPQENDPDIGQILPAKLNPGHGLLCQYTATGHNNAILSLDVLGDIMLTGSKDRTAKVWDLNTSEEILSLPQHKRDVTVVRFCPSKNTIYTVSHSALKIWDLRTGSLIKSLGGGFFSSVSESSISDLALNADGSVIYSAVGTYVKVIDARNYSSAGKLTGHTGAVTCLLVSDTGHKHDNVITGSKDHSINIYEIVGEFASAQTPCQNLEPPHYDGVQSLAMRNNYLFSGSRDNTIKKWNFSNHDLEHHFTSAHKGWVTSLDFIPNMDVLLSGDRKGLIKLWHTETCTPLGEIEAHGKSINAIKCNADAIFTASSDRLVRIWKPSEQLQQQVAELADD